MAEMPKFTIMIDELTKRELFAAMAMQGLLASPNSIAGSTMEMCAADAATMADRLIAELAK